MKFVSFSDRGRCGFGAFTDSGILDLTDHPRGVETLAEALARGGVQGLLERTAHARETRLPDDIRLEPVIPEPRKIICVGLNYRAHIAETGRDPPRHPLLFTRFASSIVGPGSALVRPRASTKFDYEGELAVVIGRTARHVSRDRALEYVAGYTCFNDGSLRDWQGHSTQFTPGKNFEGSGAMGPWLVTSDELPDPAALHLTTRVNGDTVQSAPLSDLLFDVPALIEYISTFARLEPGDVIATGTPGGVGAYRTPPLWLRPGDVVEVEIDRIGVLRNSVIDEAELASD
jgi:2-keto-4-pentenoate hydratase/2-oxohepta-3-ene-1,7-dioic acid hydratase in catechol pathway